MGFQNYDFPFFLNGFPLLSVDRASKIEHRVDELQIICLPNQKNAPNLKVEGRTEETL